MMKELFKRLKFSRKQLGLSQTQMGLKSNFEQKDISRFENGKIKFIPIPFIVFLCRQGINLNWLYTGEGPVLIQDLNNPDQQQDTPQPHRLVIPPEVRKEIDKQKEQLLTFQVENKILKKQVKELKSERKALLEAFKALGR